MCVSKIIRLPDIVGKTLSFTHKLSFFFYQSTMLSSHAEDGHQMYFVGWYRDLTHPSPNFHSGPKCAKCGVICIHFLKNLQHSTTEIQMIIIIIIIYYYYCYHRYHHHKNVSIRAFYCEDATQTL